MQYYLAVIYAAPPITFGGIYLPDYDLCLKIESPDDDNNDKIYGKYCGLDINHLIPNKHSIDTFDDKELVDIINSKNVSFMNSKQIVEYKYDKLASLLRLMYSDEKYNGRVGGICVPSTCSNDELTDAINKCNFCLAQLQLL